MSQLGTPLATHGIPSRSGPSCERVRIRPPLRRARGADRVGPVFDFAIISTCSVACERVRGFGRDDPARGAPSVVKDRGRPVRSRIGLLADSAGVGGRAAPTGLLEVRRASFAFLISATQDSRLGRDKQAFSQHHRAAALRTVHQAQRGDLRKLGPLGAPEAREDRLVLVQVEDFLERARVTPPQLLSGRGMLASRVALLWLSRCERCPDERADLAARWRDMRHLVMAVVLAVVCSACAAEVAEEAEADAAAEAVSALDDAVGSLDLGNMKPAEPLALAGGALDNPAELQKCLNACKAGGQTILLYCGRMPTPQFRALCCTAAAGGTVSCTGFCYARFVD